MKELENIINSMRFAISMDAELVYIVEEQKRMLPVLEELLKELKGDEE